MSFAGVLALHLSRRDRNRADPSAKLRAGSLLGQVEVRKLLGEVELKTRKRLGRGGFAGGWGVGGVLFDCGVAAREGHRDYVNYHSAERDFYPLAPSVVDRDI